MASLVVFLVPCEIAGEASVTPVADHPRPWGCSYRSPSLLGSLPLLSKSLLLFGLSSFPPHAFLAPALEIKLFLLAQAVPGSGTPSDHTEDSNKNPSSPNPSPLAA